jgi:thioredoxin 1
METFKSDANLEVMSKSCKVVLIDIFSTWCMPCKALAPVLDELEKEYVDKVKFFKVDVTEEPPKFVMDMGIRNVPTLLFYKDGELKQTESGYKNKQIIADALNKLI